MADHDLCAEFLRNLGRNLDGTPAAALTMRTRRGGVLHHALGLAVKLGELERNPLAEVKGNRGRAALEVDPRVVVNPRQGPQLLAAVT